MVRPHNQTIKTFLRRLLTGCSKVIRREVDKDLGRWLSPFVQPEKKHKANVSLFIGLKDWHCKPY